MINRKKSDHHPHLTDLIQYRILRALAYNPADRSIDINQPEAAYAQHRTRAHRRTIWVYPSHQSKYGSPAFQNPSQHA
ncbi:hypothetical protein DSO57_1028461 [Entomophthora muscae]|uniref:Uncharacterized protein n=1 Tax=Entomophthora muscae TaxID=34485 RepID=A0ACC2TZQ5_9FUNG|nr:hypothetical protein DSO57_1028461 [Entomophthora muscae]